MLNIKTSEIVTKTISNKNVTDGKLLNDAEYHVYSFYRFSFIKGKLRNREGVKNTPSSPHSTTQIVVELDSLLNF